MPVEVIMPKVDMDMETGRISAWRVAEGAEVTKATPLFEIETDKAAMEVESPATGRIHHVLPAGSEIRIGAPVAWIYRDGEEVGPPPHIAEAPAETHAAKDVPAQPVAVQVHASQDVRATPKARRAARDASIDLTAIPGSAAGGRVVHADVTAHLEAAEPAPVTGELNLVRTGEGDQTPFFLIHGFCGDATAWALLEPELPQGHERLMLELPAHGQSPHLPVGDFAGLARHITSAFDAAGLDRVHLVGHSLGGALALALADIRPRKIATLTLFAPAGLGPDVDGTVLEGLVRANQAESLGPWLRALVHAPETITSSHVQAAMTLRADPQMRAAQTRMAATLFPDSTQTMDLRPALQRIQCPTRLVWGREDRIVPWRHALTAPGNIALHLFTGCGHLPHVERVAETAALLAETARTR